MPSSTTATCRSCGDTFDVSEELRERYPGWTPSQCQRCYRGAKGSGGASGGSRASSSKRGRRTRVEENLTLDEVLEKYADGPDTGVFTDGSATPNPGPGGWGAVYVVDGEVVAQAHGHEVHTTNNRMELLAVIEGIALVPEGTAATIYSDSKLVVQTLNEWAAGWKARGWKRKTGPVENLDLVKRAHEAFEARPELDLEWIRAHDGSRWNEYADALSTGYRRDEL